ISSTRVKAEREEIGPAVRWAPQPIWILVFARMEESPLGTDLPARWWSSKCPQSTHRVNPDGARNRPRYSGSGFLGGKSWICRPLSPHHSLLLVAGGQGFIPPQALPAGPPKESRMLTLLDRQSGSAGPFSRREFLRVGSLALGGLALP